MVLYPGGFLPASIYTDQAAKIVTDADSAGISLSVLIVGTTPKHMASCVLVWVLLPLYFLLNCSREHVLTFSKYGQSSLVNLLLLDGSLLAV